MSHRSPTMAYIARVVLTLSVIGLFDSSDGAITQLAFDQNLDHFNSSDKRTFPQRYWLRDDYWKKEEGAPVLLFLGLAAPAFTDFFDSGVYDDTLKQHQALGVLIENRYYGSSLTSDMLRRDYLKYLTFEQSIEDTKAIQDFVRQNLSIPDHRWITFGASYSGIKSAIHRITYPERFFAAYASSAPLAFQHDMPDYLGHVGLVIADKNFGGSPACFANVQAAFAELDAALNRSDFEQIRSDFSICNTSQLASESDKYALAQFLSGLIADKMQNSFSNPATNPYASVCVPFTRPDTSPYEVLKRIRWESNPAGCSDVSYTRLLDDLMIGADGIANMTTYSANPGGRAWAYEICANIGFNAYCDRTKGCPLSSYLSKELQFGICRDVFGISVEQMKASSEKYLKTYGGKEPNTSKLLLVHGMADCGFPYELTEVTAAQEGNEIYSVVIPFVGHIADISPPMPYEPVALNQQRQKAMDQLSKWMQAGSIKATTNGQLRLTVSIIPIFVVYLVIHFVPHAK